MSDDLGRLYLELLKKSLTGTNAQDVFAIIEPRSPLLRVFYRPTRRILSTLGLDLVRRYPADAPARVEGHDWPADALTMVGLLRLDHLQSYIERVLADDIPGDLIECGVWRGGACIFMRGVLKAYAAGRTVWVADSFRGLPKADAAALESDRRQRLWSFASLSVPEQQVRANFDRFGLLDEQVRFLPGWFEDSLAKAPIERLAVLRLDGDMYGSTHTALWALYPKLSAGGYCIVDDYFAVPGARQAVDEFRSANGLTEPVRRIDWAAAFWRREQ